MVTEEELQNMSPEELAEFQKKNCIFCHIVTGKVQSKKIYEDETCVAILDINPANPGHVLIMPKEHFSIMPQVPDQIISHLFMVAKGISHASLKGLKSTGTHIFVANGITAGQKAQHFMIHMIPRKEDDGLNVFALPEKEVPEKDYLALQENLKKAIDQYFGTAEPGQAATQES